MKLKINLSTMIILSFMLWQQVTATADEPSVDANNTGTSGDTSPVDILFIIDNSKSMKIITGPPMSPEERKSWEEFKQIVANMEFDKLGIRIRFSLDENKQLRCFHSMMHNSITNCTDIINRMFSSIRRAKEQGILTVRPAEALVEDFISQELEDIKTVEQMKASMERFMQQVGFNNLAFDISVVTHEVDASDQPK